jgi:methylmalonyl-CoA mutase
MSKFSMKEFDPVSSKAWKQKIQVDLKGADYNETLLTATNEGITIKPYYHADDFERLVVPDLPSEFTIAQLIKIDDKEEMSANQRAKKVLDKGVEALVITADQVFDVETVFEGLLERQVEFHLQLEFLDPSFVDQLGTLLKNERVNFNIDPIGHLTRTGNWHRSVEADMDVTKRFVSKYSTQTVLGIDLDLYQNAGANTIQQVSYALGHLTEYLSRIQATPELSVQFRTAVGGQYFFEIAKLRALRHLADRVIREYGFKPEIKILATSSLRNKTLYDYNVNLLRTTTEGMSAILGGASTVLAQPYDRIFHDSREFGERIARNQLLILREESYFKKAPSFANDTYFIESITLQIAEKALNLFKDMERSGGFLKQLFEGTVQRKIRENANKEQVHFEQGEISLLGTNKFPNWGDRMKGELSIDPFPSRRNAKSLIEPVVPKRLAQNHELNRLSDES